MIDGERDPFGFDARPPYVLSLAYLALFGSIVAFTAFSYCLNELPASTVGTYAYVNPVVAVFLGWLSGLALSQFVAVHHIQEGMSRHLVVNFGIVVGACTIVFVGLWDDIFRMSPWKKIAGQVAAAICLLATGIGHRAARPRGVAVQLPPRRNLRRDHTRTAPRSGTTEHEEMKIPYLQVDDGMDR